jgi:hypothetical protein
MEASAANGPAERDTAADWRIEPGVPVTIAELEGRIDVAIATAQTAEEAALEIGAASLEAAEQARRAAALAERASAAAARAASEVAEMPRLQPRRPTTSAGLPVGDEPPVATPAPSGGPAARVPADDERAADAEPPVDDTATALPTPLDLPTTDRSARRRPDPFDERITAFRQRAERVMIRLQKLEAGADPGDGPSEIVRLG